MEDPPAPRYPRAEATQRLADVMERGLAEIAAQLGRIADALTGNHPAR